MKVIRWLAIVPLAVLAWYATMIFAITIHLQLAKFCVREDFISGICAANWYTIAGDFLLHAGTALSAFLVIVVSATIAPSQKIGITWLAFAIVTLIASYMGHAIGEYAALATTIAVGLGTALLVHRRLKSRCHASSQQA